MVEAVFGTLKAIIEFKNKGEELEEEKDHLKLVSQWLLSGLSELDKDKIDPKLLEKVESLLEEAKELLNTEIKKGFFENIKNMLPNSICSRIKDVTAKLERLNTMLSTDIQKNLLKRKTNSESGSETEKNQIKKTTKLNSISENAGPTLNQDDFFGPTLVDNDEDLIDNDKDKTIASFTLVGSPEVEKLCKNQKDFKSVINYIAKDGEPDEKSIEPEKISKEIFQIKRADYVFLPKEISVVISNHHASVFLEIIHKKVRKPATQSQSQSQSEKKSAGKDEEIFATCVERDDDDEVFEKPDEIVFVPEFKFFIKDMSTNGSYIIKENKKDNIVRIKKNELVEIGDGDIIGFAKDKSSSELKIGYKMTKYS